MSIDSIKHVASKQAEWKALSVRKMELLQEIKSNLSALNMEDKMQLLGIPATMMGLYQIAPLTKPTQLPGGVHVRVMSLRCHWC
jgi:hypothetical protein